MELDLHGVRHKDVEDLVIDFLLNNEAPLYIVTGNSNEMQKIVFNILDNYESKYFIPSYNLGQIIVTER